MKTYESLKLDIIRFEAQDVVTASTPEPECICWFNMESGKYRHYNLLLNTVCPAASHNHDCNKGICE